MVLGVATVSVFHWVDVGSDMIWYDWWFLLHKPDSVAGSVYDSAIRLKHEELSLQLTSGTRICELVCRLKKDNFEQIPCDSVNNWLNMCASLTWWDVIVIYA